VIREPAKDAELVSIVGVVRKDIDQVDNGVNRVVVQPDGFFHASTPVKWCALDCSSILSSRRSVNSKKPPSLGAIV